MRKGSDRMKRKKKTAPAAQESSLNFYTTVKFLWSIMDGMKKHYLLFYFCWLFHTIAGVVSPLIFGKMIDRVIYDNDLPGFLKIGMGFFGITVFGIALYYVTYELYSVVWNGIHRRLRVGIFRKLQTLTAEEMTALQHGDTGNMILFWTSEGVHFMVRNVVHNVNNCLRILFCLVVMFLINPVFGLVSVVIVPLSVIATFSIGKRIRANSGKGNEIYAKYISRLFEIAGMFGEIKVWGAKDYVLKKYDGDLKEMNRVRAKIDMENCVGNEVLANIKNVILVIQYGVLAYFAITGNLQVGTITVMLAYFNTMSDSLASVAKYYMDAQQRISIIERIFRFLKKPGMDTKRNGVKPEGRSNEIKVKNCNFRYENSETDVLSGIDFSVKRGEKVAVVGGSGAGKSTLLNLLLGLYEPQQGDILLDDISLTQIDRDALYHRFGAAFQHVLLFSGTIRENLEMGDTISEEKLIKACSDAGISEYISEQKEGLDTVLERWGSNLSGGQRQRFGIARAYVQGSDFVFLDEVTAALDADTEALVLKRLEEGLQGRGCVMVSHRLKTVEACDRVIVLKDGKICAEGTPQRLREQCEEYQSLFGLARKGA